MNTQRLFSQAAQNDNHVEEAPPSTVPEGKDRKLAPKAVATLPSGAAGDRNTLIGALAFMEGAVGGHFGVRELRAWFDDFLVRPGHMESRPMWVIEEDEPAVFIGDSSLSLDVRDRTVHRVITASRRRVFDLLNGLLREPEDDMFLVLLAATGRIWPDRLSLEGGWCVTPRQDDPLHLVVLALFAAHILTNRELYRFNLTICSTCDRISFRERPQHRDRCRLHEAESLRSPLRAAK